MQGSGARECTQGWTFSVGFEKGADRGSEDRNLSSRSARWDRSADGFSTGTQTQKGNKKEQMVDGFDLPRYPLFPLLLLFLALDRLWFARSPDFQISVGLSHTTHASGVTRHARRVTNRTIIMHVGSLYRSWCR